MIRPNRSDVLTAAKILFDGGPLVMRKLQHLRPHICPFEAMLPFVPPGTRVLDIGCGSGLFLGLLRYFGWDVDGLGFDSSPVAIESANVMAERHGEGKLRFQFVSPDDAWPAGSFDVVSMIDVMHHIPTAHQKQALQAAAERVAPGGLLLYKDMADGPFATAAANRLHDLVVARQWIRYVPIATLEQWAASLGMTAEFAQSYRLLWYRHDLRVFRVPPLR